MSRRFYVRDVDMFEMPWLDTLQWPALLVTIAAAWMVSTDARRKRLQGFYLFLVSNVLWIAWGLHDHAYAVVGLQLFLGVTNVHGIVKNST